MTERALLTRSLFLHRFTRHRGASLAGILLALILATVFLGPYLWPLSPDDMDLKARNQGPSFTHPMGTDQLGRDMFAAIIRGGQISLFVGFLAMAVSISIGTLIGVIAGVFRRLDAPLMRLTDLFLALPILPLILVTMMLWRDPLRASFGPEGGVFVLVVSVIALTSWMQTARVVRGEILALREREFVTAATALGVGPFRLITAHMLPNLVGVIAVSATLGIANAILTESALSFLGLGFPSDFPSWGRLLQDGTAYLSVAPWRAIWPGIAISLTVLCVNFLGDGLRDALDPRSARSFK